MRRFVLSLAIAVLALGFSSRTQAKDMCVQDDFGDFWKFSGVKSFKTGKPSLLLGTYGVGTYNAPVIGVANPVGGVVSIGLQVHSMAPFSGNNFSATFVTDLGLTGGGFYDNGGTGYDSDGAINFTAVSCGSLPIVNSPAQGPGPSVAPSQQ